MLGWLCVIGCRGGANIQDVKLIAEVRFWSSILHDVKEYLVMLLLIWLEELLLCIEVGDVRGEKASSFAFLILDGLYELLD